MLQIRSVFYELIVIYYCPKESWENLLKIVYKIKSLNIVHNK